MLVVDLSRGFTDPSCALGSNLDDVVAANVRLLAAARARHVPVVFTTIAFSEAPADGGVWLQKVPSLATLQAGSKWVEIDPRLGARPDETVITKRFASAFFGTHLPTVLTALGADTVIMTGATTSGCVRASGIDSMQYGYPTVIPRECVGDRHDAPHEANLFDLDAKYSDVTTLANVLDYIEGLDSTVR
ncbi:MAG: isochorismatase family protein [Microbacteriaceae bacterium]